ITKGTATLTLSNLTQGYDGSPKPATVTTSPAGLSGVSITYGGSATVPTNVGSYAVVASLNNANYTASTATGTLTTTNATATQARHGHDQPRRSEQGLDHLRWIGNRAHQRRQLFGCRLAEQCELHRSQRHRHADDQQGDGDDHPQQPDADLRWIGEIRHGHDQPRRSERRLDHLRRIVNRAHQRRQLRRCGLLEQHQLQ